VPGDIKKRRTPHAQNETEMQVMIREQASKEN
jgi:hypothetical protein